LLLRANGLGMTWDLADYRQWTDMNTLAEIREHERIVGILVIGYADQVEDAPGRSAIQDKVEVW